MPSKGTLIAFASLLLLCVHESSAWDIVSTSGVAPSIRSWPSLAATDFGLISFGGVYDNFNTNIYTFYNDLSFFHPILRHWTVLNPSGTPPSPRMVVARAFDDRQNRFYIYGGTNYNADFSVVDIYGDFFYYDLDLNTWVEVHPENSGPGPRTGAVMTIQGNYLYVFGGLDSYFGGHADLWSYNLRTNRWTELVPPNRLAPRPTGMQYSPIHYYLGDLIIGSGEGGIENGFAFINEWWKFNLLEKTWTQFTFTNSYGAPRDYLASSLYFGKLFIYGGDTPTSVPPCCNSPYPQNPTNNTWYLDIHRNTWHEVNTPAPMLKRHLGATLGDKFYVHGGWGWDNNDVGQLWNPYTMVLDLDEALFGF